MKRCSISRSSAASCTAAACSKVVARPEMIHLVVKDSAARHCVRSMCPSRQKSPARQSSTLNPQRKVFSSPVSGRIRCRTDSSCTCCTCCTSPHERRVKQQRLICDTSRAGGVSRFLSLPLILQQTAQARHRAREELGRYSLTGLTQFFNVSPSVLGFFMRSVE